MTAKIRDAVIVITGASSGIGRATALECARRGASVVVSGRRHSALNELARQCEDEGGGAIAVPADVNDPEAMKHLAREAVDRFGRIDVWFNNAAVTVAGYFDEVPEDVYRQVIETNLFGVINGTRAALPYFREQGRGTLINHSSVIGKFGTSKFSAYSTSKAGIIGFSESLRQEMRGTGIDVCVVLPAAIDTPIYNQAANFSGLTVKPVDPIYPASQVARAVCSLIERPRPQVYVGATGKLVSLIREVAPYALTDRLIGRTWEQDHFTARPADRHGGNVFEPDANHQTVSGGWPSSQPSRTPYLLAGLATVILPAIVLWRRSNGARGS